MNLTASATRVVATAAAAAVLGSLGTPGAFAGSVGARDKRGDMASHGADIHSVAVINDKLIRVRVDHKDLIRSYKAGSSIQMFVDTDRERKGPEFVFVGGLTEGSDYALLRARNWRRVGDMPLVAKYSMSLDYARDITRIRFGRGALGNPQKVRVSVKTGGELDGRTVTDWLRGRRWFTQWVGR